MEIRKRWTKEQIGIIQVKGKESNDFLTYELLGQRFNLWTMEGKKQKILDTISSLKELNIDIALDKYSNIMLILTIKDSKSNFELIKALEKLDLVRKLSPDIFRKDGRFLNSLKLYKEE